MTQTISHHTHNIYIRKEFGVPEYSDIHTLIFESRSILSRLAHDETTNFIFLQQARSKYLTLSPGTFIVPLYQLHNLRQPFHHMQRLCTSPTEQNT